MAEQQAVQGVVAVIERDRRLLVIRRAEGIAAAGWWCFPGGAIEPGETPHEALCREVREELGLEVVPHEQLWRWERADKFLVLHWFRAVLCDGECEWRLHPGEVAEARWVRPEELLAMSPVLENNLTFIRQIYTLSRSPNPEIS